ncbi:hypothetical protein Glove_102g47 [Diversispora epigaea]|uniref:Reverse transcriptase domain-containing protein n=1 Tax=Diversispora epigaea TaxID=1348612 RepID=A0A397J871_9GLOM|nr:hypothetical protein Glove_102g47 [Diversispora epigaea]
MIWISSNLLEALEDTEVKNKELEARSDHKCVVTQLKQFFVQGKIESNKQVDKRNIYVAKIVKEKAWIKFREMVNDGLSKSNFSDRQTAEKQWNIIKETILEAASKTIPKKRVVSNKRGADQFISPNDISYRLMNGYRRLFNQVKTYFYQLFDDNREQVKSNIIKTIKTISEITEETPKEIHWNASLDEMKPWLMVTKRKFRTFQKFYKAELDKKKQQLSRDKRTIISDSVIIKEHGNSTLVSDPEEVKNHIVSSFEKWTRKRETTINKLNKFWYNVFQLKSNINQQWYEETIAPFTIEELTSCITATNNISAPGQSGIPYFFFKHLGHTALTCILQMFNMILSTGVTPRDWSLGYLFPIPKPSDWQKNINKTRPITLLETSRKIFMKAITRSKGGRLN